jgi:hypothetical protein
MYRPQKFSENFSQIKENQWNQSLPKLFGRMAEIKGTWD